MKNKENKLLRAMISCALVVAVNIGLAGDWNQYRGPLQDGISKEKFNLDAFKNGPKILWKIETPNGFSSFSIADGKAFTIVSRNVDGESREVCLAVDANTGKELWATPIGFAKYQPGGDTGTADNKGGDGPRCTPNYNNGRIYVINPKLVLSCLDANNGKILWQKDIMKEHSGRYILWENAASVVIDGDLLFIGGGGAGQSLIAMDKITGTVVWKGFDERITHSTPVVATIHNIRQVIFFLQSGLLSVETKTGRELWRYPFRFNVSTAISPVVCGDDLVFCSAGYDVGSGLCKITKEGNNLKANEVWKIRGNDPVCTQWSTPVYKDGYLYGMFSFKKFGTGPVKCIEVATGTVKWEKLGFGMGNIILVDDKLVALSDDGRVVIIEPTSSEYRELASSKVLNGKCWSTPAFSNGKLYIRSTKEGACIDVSGK